LMSNGENVGLKMHFRLKDIPFFRNSKTNLNTILSCFSQHKT
jgi:hypothetical protein